MVESEDVKKAEIDRLYKENVSKVYRTALYYVEDHYVAEEIVQEVFQNYTTTWEIYVWSPCLHG